MILNSKYKLAICSGEQAAELANTLSLIGGNFRPEDTVCLCNTVDDDVIHTVVVFNRFNKNDVEATIISDGSFIPRTFIRSVYEYVFYGQRKNVLIMYTSVENDRMNKIHKKLGHRLVGVVPGKFEYSDANMWVATPEILERWAIRQEDRRYRFNKRNVDDEVLIPMDETWGVEKWTLKEEERRKLRLGVEN